MSFITRESPWIGFPVQELGSRLDAFCGQHLRPECSLGGEKSSLSKE
jgi:hypothetical protein